MFGFFYVCFMIYISRVQYKLFFCLPPQIFNSVLYSIGYNSCHLLEMIKNEELQIEKGVKTCLYIPLQPTHDLPASRGPSATKVRKTISSRVHEAVKAIALVHNVTPVYESNGVTDQAEAEQHYEDTCRVYQASSPDEVWCTFFQC